MSQAILRLTEVTARTGLSRSTIYRLVSIGSFPRPINLGSRSVGWLESEVQAWLDGRIAQRDRELSR